MLFLTIVVVVEGEDDADDDDAEWVPASWMEDDNEELSVDLELELSVAITDCIHKQNKRAKVQNPLVGTSRFCFWMDIANNFVA